MQAQKAFSLWLRKIFGLARSSRQEMTSEEKIEGCVESFRRASDDSAKVYALDDVAAHFRGTNSKPIAKFLAEVVLAESYCKDVRLVAYLVLYEVCGRALDTLPDVN